MTKQEESELRIWEARECWKRTGDEKPQRPKPSLTKAIILTVFAMIGVLVIGLLLEEIGK